MTAVTASQMLKSFVSRQIIFDISNVVDVRVVWFVDVLDMYTFNPRDTSPGTVV